MTETEAPVLACRPNITAAGRRMRRRFGYVQFSIAAAMFLGFMAFGVAGLVRALVFLPVTGGALGLLQARRNT